jgi:hypothetical protein
MSSNLKPFTVLAAVVFALVALAHLMRVVFGLEVVVGDVVVPLSVSVIATLVAACLSFMIWRESRA